MKKIQILGGATFVAALWLASCQPDIAIEVTDTPTLPAQTYDYRSSNNASNSTYRFNEKATLGRVLFYDTKLSLNNTVACASCHQQHLGFADNKQFSEGFETKKTARNSPSLANIGMNRSFFWDGRSTSLSTMVLMPIADHVEMGLEQSEQLCRKLSSLPYYPNLFNSAFGSPTISKEAVSEALTSFLISFNVNNSKADRAQINRLLWDNVGLPSFTPEENKGLQLFRDNGCISCHNTDDLSAGWSPFANIGLDASYENGRDLGASLWVENAEKGSFKVPSLKNVALSAPYMHDGRFKTLMEVVEHYNSGILGTPDLDWRLTDNTGGLSQSDIALINSDPFIRASIMQNLRTGFGNTRTPRRMNMTQEDKECLVAFLHTLTDGDFISNPKYSNPFRKQ